MNNINKELKELKECMQDYNSRKEIDFWRKWAQRFAAIIGTMEQDFSKEPKDKAFDMLTEYYKEKNSL